MHSSMWKLTALAGVVGIASLVIFQAQRNLNIAGAASVETQDDDSGTAESGDSQADSPATKDWEEPPDLASAETSAAEEIEAKPIRKRRAPKSVDADPFNEESKPRAGADRRRKQEKGRKAEAAELESDSDSERVARDDEDDDTVEVAIDKPKRRARGTVEIAELTESDSADKPAAETTVEAEVEASFDPFEAEKRKIAAKVEAGLDREQAAEEKIEEKIEEAIRTPDTAPQVVETPARPKGPIIRPGRRSGAPLVAAVEEDTVEVPTSRGRNLAPAAHETETAVIETPAERQAEIVVEDIPASTPNPADELLPRAVITSPHSTPGYKEGELAAPPGSNTRPGVAAGNDSRPAPRAQPKPQLTIEKQAPPNAVLGQPLVYKILVKNVGPTAAQQVVVEDVIPDGTQLTGTIPRAELSGKRLIWKIGTLQPKEEKIIKVRIVPKSEGEIGSIATVNFVADAAARPVAPKLDFDVKAPPRVRLGESFALNFKITNVGQSDAPKVLLRDLIPESLQHPGGNDLENDLGAIPVGESRDIELTLTAIKAGPAVNRAFVTTEGGISVERQVQVEVIGPQLTINRKGPPRLYLNRAAIFSNVITNESQQPFAALSVIENIPEGFQFVQASPPAEYDAARRTAVWKIPALRPGENVNLKVTLMPKAKGMQSTAIRLFASGREHVVGKFDARVEGLPSVAIEVSEASVPFAVGERITYQVRVVNRGSDRATRTALTIGIPEELRLVKAEGPVPFRLSGDQLVFEPIAQLEMDGLVDFKIEFDALTAGDARLQIQMQADHLQKPVTREESITLIDAQQ